MTITELVQKLTEAGATPLIISIAVEAVESMSASVLRTNTESPADIPDTRADRIRKLDRLRKQKKRQLTKKTRELAKANDVAKPPGNHADKNNDVSTDKAGERSNLASFLPSLITSERGNQEEEIKDRVVTPAKDKRGVRLSPDAVLSEEDYRYAADRIPNPGEAWEEFKDYWCAIPGYRGLKLTWSGAWRTRVRELAKRNGGTNGHRTHHTNGNGRGSGASVFAAMANGKLNGGSRPEPRDTQGGFLELTGKEVAARKDI